MTNEAEGIWYEFHDRLRAFIARRVDNGADTVLIASHRGFTKSRVMPLLTIIEQRSGGEKSPPTLLWRLKRTEMAFRKTVE